MPALMLGGMRKLTEILSIKGFLEERRIIVQSDSVLALQ